MGFVSHIPEDPLYIFDSHGEHQSAEDYDPAHFSVCVTFLFLLDPGVAAASLELELDFQKARIQIWLFEQKDLRIEGRIIGFDEYMNLVLDDAEEVNVKKKSKKALGENDDHPAEHIIEIKFSLSLYGAIAFTTTFCNILAVKPLQLPSVVRVWEERLDYERSQEKVVVAGGTHVGSGNHTLLARLTIVLMSSACNWQYEKRHVYP
ncbi:small nuclear ribonucleoprotein E-like [Cucumis melo var. makuwa]|uniref:Small nuclear ribonucleoprotein E n=1 Tax=Cucumis melo var. makuwa TaxID=1194695 RepID=A0A5A7VEN8_CUCMM|nr:small nuclear ribonucleoprotein E-like [Cucumis melo var. makuwa]TYK09475.1 small nuclear ribonucleoprotein E-like [Cucumis melo var. makuwa]